MADNEFYFAYDEPPPHRTIIVAEDPLTCVVRGTGEVLQDLDRLSRVLVTETYSRPLR